jgi:hypothetical protein
MRVRRSAPIIAVLAQPDNQELGERADAYNRLIKDMAVLPVAAAPAQGRTGAGYVLTLDGEWKQGRLDRFGHTLGFAPERYIVPGMSGSPIVSAAGAGPSQGPQGKSCVRAIAWETHPHDVDLDIVAHDTGASTARRHRAGIRIGQRYLLVRCGEHLRLKCMDAPLVQVPHTISRLL